MRALVCIYNPADLFPPTLNAVRELANEFDEVVLITTKQSNENLLTFPANVKVVYALKNMQRGASAIGNLSRFMRFVFQVWGVMTKSKFDLALMYDPHAWLSVNMSRSFFAIPPRVYWYHNHDVYELSSQRKYSAAWYAVKQQAKHFKELDIFSLPANERKKYFPMQSLRGNYFFIPNYPAVQFMQQFEQARPSNSVIRLVHQGRISEGHGFEEIIDMLDTPINAKQLQLVLKGFVHPDYRSALQLRAKQKGVSDQLEFHGPSAYAEVPRITSGCHIGLAIHQKRDLMNTTLGTSSNKIYEYAALGLPVMLLDDPHFREHLGKYSWAYFTDCSSASLTTCIEAIDKNYETLSAGALKDFKANLNFESCFRPAVSYCKHLLIADQSVPAP